MDRVRRLLDFEYRDLELPAAVVASFLAGYAMQGRCAALDWLDCILPILGN